MAITRGQNRLTSFHLKTLQETIDVGALVNLHTRAGALDLHPNEAVAMPKTDLETLSEILLNIFDGLIIS